MTTNVDVLVVGAGPVGLLAACELTRQGVTVALIDKLTAPTDQSRAIIVHARTQELLDRMGIVERFDAASNRATEMQMRAGDTTVASVSFDEVDSRFPYSLLLPQTETERILTEHLAELGGTIERGVELTGLIQDDAVVRADVRHADGSTATIEASWVVGADGSHSTVRDQVGSRLVGVFEGERFLLADVDADHDLSSSSMYTVFSADGPVLLFPMPGGRLRVIAQIRHEPSEPINLDPGQDEVQQVLDARVGGIAIRRAHWLTEFEVHHAQVPSYRVGRVLLAGDAAHVHSPAGGQGMNTGLQDAYNLAWKVARCVRGESGDALLDSYQAERHPVAAGVISFSTRLTDLGTMGGSVRTAVRNRLMHLALGLTPIRDKVADRIEEVDLSYRGSPVVVGAGSRHLKPGDHAPAVADEVVRRRIAGLDGATSGHLVLTFVPAGAGVPPPAALGVQVAFTAEATDGTDGYDAVVADGGAAADRFGLSRGGRVVVRPDGYVGAIVDVDDPLEGYRAALG